ncbi:unnamed protein product [Effrenium voratum]|nr:unnamed protein product [Effrenium voratum]|mmetsp:Transcript_18624/g.44079  ORF Transcript_18624/g.44079 Transcript_18624/m.44079 type:complete len:283 (+) Transcript_18624:83-931(+)|eukprot:CAMPEP_0181453558 /NCGR_PEP_ID=MMETSP1110-20121109/29788_1 /TAXON_ID=174948 /ORGANISM="Symbiodinium sp., Strain CCMP421" /LENGTH=282 /DNA_ID=CAMNT_0023577883 /DNA_START=79 /DNA_END=927 /DNA_ORIENTATION=-
MIRVGLLLLYLRVALSARLGADGHSASLVDDLPALKLVINSNKFYVRPREMLMASMKAARFRNFSNVILVVGGAQKDQVLKDGELTVVETSFMSFDLTALSVLWHYRHHPAVRAQAYLYLLDTTTVGIAFPEKFHNFSTVERVGYWEYRAPPIPGSNICLFGRGVVESYQTNFDTALAKQEGLLFEHGHSPHGVHQLQLFAYNVTRLRARVEHGDPVDLYETGYSRRVFWYPDIDVFKYILWDKTGDLIGHIHSLDNVQVVADSKDETFYWEKLWHYVVSMR